MKIFAIGLNYLEHNKALHGSLLKPEEPVIFMKPETALLKDHHPFFIPDDMDSYIQTKNANYEIYQKETEQGGYVLYVRADDTLLSISGPGKDKEDIISFVTELGYYREN